MRASLLKSKLVRVVYANGLTVKEQRANNKRIVDERIKARTAKIVIGGRYFKSDFYDQRGAWVIVTAKSTKLNNCGWPSSVEYRVVESVNNFVSAETANPDKPFNHTLVVGYVGTCNATNLYERREDASRLAKLTEIR
jgi:hypothetical protein